MSGYLLACFASFTLGFWSGYLRGRAIIKARLMARAEAEGSGIVGPVPKLKEPGTDAKPPGPSGS